VFFSQLNASKQNTYIFKLSKINNGGKKEIKLKFRRTKESDVNTDSNADSVSKQDHTTTSLWSVTFDWAQPYARPQHIQVPCTS